MNPRRKQRRAERKSRVAASPFSIDPRRRRIFAGFALCALTLLAYWNSFEAGFVLDSPYIILGAPQIQEATRHNIGLILQHGYWWPKFELSLYRPFTTLSYLFNYAVLGNRDQPAGYHWINLILHAGNVVLAYVLASRLIREFWPAVLTAAVWAVHPVSTEAVTNIVGRADLLATMCVLGGLLMYLKTTETAGRRRMMWLAGLMAAATAGMFSKESAVALLGVMILYELTWWKERRRHLAHLWGCLGGCLAVAAPLGAMLYQRSRVLAHARLIEFPFTDNPILGASFWQGRLTAINVIARYVLITLWPAKLSSDYSYAEVPLARGTFTDWISWIAVGALVAGVGLLYLRNRTTFFFACFAAFTFVPGSNLLFPTGTIMAERLIYLPSFGVLACLVLAIYAAAQRIEMPLLPPLVLGLIIPALLIRTWSRNADWQSDLELSKSAAQASPGSYKAHHSYAYAAYGADPSLSRLSRVTSEASFADLNLIITEEEKSMAILDTLPDSLKISDPYIAAGEYYLMKGDYLRQRSGAEAAAAYQRALQIALQALPLANADRRASNLQEQVAGLATSPSADQDSEAYQLLSTLYLRTGDFEKARETGGVARTLAPLLPQVHRQVADALLGLGRGDEAAIALAEGILITSNSGLRQELADVYRKADPKGCETTQGPGGSLQINASCEAVRRDFCAASVDALKATLQAGRRDLAESEEKSLLQDYRCPASPLDELLLDRTY